MFSLFGGKSSSASAPTTLYAANRPKPIPALNGRVEFKDAANPYTMYNETGKGNGFAREALGGMINVNSLSDVYFSQANLDAVQDAIRYRVYVDSDNKYVISRQSDAEVQIIMRSTYYQHSKNLPFDILGQVKVLNKKVLDWAVPRIIQEINQYQQYKADASMLPVPLSQPQNVSSAGNKFLFMPEL